MNDKEIWKDYQQALIKENEAQEKNTNDILIHLSEKLDDDYIQAIKEWLSDEENGIWGDLKIVKETIGEWQDEVNEYDKECYWNILKGMYVNQYCGYTGDDYSGTLEIKISENEFLRASFYL